MTINATIAAVNLAIAVAFVALGLALLWQSRSSLRAWPVSALVALAGPYLGAGVVLVQLAIWRLDDTPGLAFDANGPGTLLVRAAVAFVAVALLQRIVRGRLLTSADHERVTRP